MRLARPRDMRASEIRDLVVARLAAKNLQPVGERVGELIYAIVYEVLRHIEDE